MRWQDEPWFAVVAAALAGVVLFTLHFAVGDDGLTFSLVVGVLWFFALWFVERRRRMKRHSPRQG